MDITFLEKLINCMTTVKLSLKQETIIKFSRKVVKYKYPVIIINNMPYKYTSQTLIHVFLQFISTKIFIFQKFSQNNSFVSCKINTTKDLHIEVNFIKYLSIYFFILYNLKIQ